MVRHLPLPARRRRRRHRGRRRRHYRRRHLAIRRPAGTYYTIKYSRFSEVTVPSRSSHDWYVNRWTTTLNEWETSPKFDYYKILKMKITIVPTDNPYANSSQLKKLLHGWTIIDWDGPWTLTGETADFPYHSSTTRRKFTVGFRHSRYFSPKPRFLKMGDQNMLFFTAGKGDPWLNTNESAVTWGALDWCVWRPSGYPSFAFGCLKEVWIKYRSHI